MNKVPSVVDGVLLALSTTRVDDMKKVEVMFSSLEKLVLESDQIECLVRGIADITERKPFDFYWNIFAFCYNRDDREEKKKKLQLPKFQTALLKISRSMQDEVRSGQIGQDNTTLGLELTVAIWLYRTVQETSKGVVGSLLRTCGEYLDLSRTMECLEKEEEKEGFDLSAANLICVGAMMQLGAYKVLKDRLRERSKVDAVRISHGAFTELSVEEIQKALLDANWSQKDQPELQRKGELFGELKRKMGSEEAIRWAKAELSSDALPEFSDM